ncbi:MAG: protein kinase [Acidobacteriia bacterium]|nr:protein kinase [Terriglobia bacterium]
MNPDAWRQISDVFSDCLKRSAGDRERFLADLETTQPEIVREVRELLANYDEDQAFLEQPGIDQLTSWEAETADPISSPPQQGFFGRWLRHRPTAFWVLLAVDIIALGLYVFGGIQIHRYGMVTITMGWDATLEKNGWKVDRVDVPGPAATKLKPGDIVTAVDGKPAGGTLSVDLESIPPGSSYVMRILRNGAEQDITLTRVIVPNALGAAGTFSYLLVSIAFFLTAVVVGFLKPDQRIAQLAWAALLTEALTLLKVVLIWYEEFLPGLSFAVLQGLQVVDGPHFALAYHFYSRAFAHHVRKWRAPLIVLYAWGALVAVERLVLLNRSTLLFWAEHVSVMDRLERLLGALYLVGPLSACVAIVRNYFITKDPEEHRRARWIVAGTVAGILPYVIVRAIGFAAFMTGNPSEREIDAYQFALALAVAPAVLIPIATGYAILKHRLFDINVVIRRSIQYLLAKSVLQFVLALPALAFCYALVTNANRTVADVVLHHGFFLVLVVLIGVVLKFREQLRNWLDRKFFRESYQQEHLLIGLIENIKKLHSVVEISERVGSDLAAAFHPESAMVFYHRREQRAFISGYSSNPSTRGLQISDRSLLAATLGRSEDPQDLTALRSRLGGTADGRWFVRFGIDLAVPMAGTDGALVGFVLLGRKMSEEPYTHTDRKLLKSLADQMAILYENISLQERLQEERKTAQQMRARVEAQGIPWLQECPQCGRCFDSSIRNCDEDGSELILSCPVLQVIDGRYHLERALGKGGMGAVFEASDLRLKRKVAIKLVLASTVGDPASLRRLGREARALARLSHPNIVATYDFGMIESEAAYLVMEFVPGSTLRTEITKGRILPAIAADWFDQLLEGVKAAHAAGVVHRDLKPENVLIASPDNGKRQVKIADFGIAKWSLPGLESTNLTAPGTVVGSFHYMSPEQLAGQTVDERSDIFSVGVMVFEVLTGQIPFKGKTYTERIVSILQDSPQFESALPGASDLHAALGRCLAKNAADRFTSAAQLQAEIVPVIASYSVPGEQGRNPRLRAVSNPDR